MGGPRVAPVGSGKKANPVDAHVGSRIRMRRMMISMSQEKLGDAIGLTFQQVQKYEKGTNRVGASRLQQISGVLQVEPAFFFEGAPGSITKVVQSPTYVQTFLTTSDGLAIASAFTRIKSGRVRRLLADLAEEMAEEE